MPYDVTKLESLTYIKEVLTEMANPQTAPSPTMASLTWTSSSAEIADENEQEGAPEALERATEMFDRYFGVYKKKRVPLLNMINGDPYRIMWTIWKRPIATAIPGLTIFPWGPGFNSIHWPFTSWAQMMNNWAGAEMLKVVELKGADYWKDRKVHDVGSGLNVISIRLHQLGAEVISRCIGTEHLIIGACNIIYNNAEYDYDFGFDCIQTIETDSDTYIFHLVFDKYGYAQMNVDTMRYLAKMGKEVLFTAPRNRRQLKLANWLVPAADGTRQQELFTFPVLFDLKESEYDVVLSTKFLGDPEEWGPREVMQMKV